MIPFETLLAVNDTQADRTWTSEPDFGQTPWNIKSTHELFSDRGDHAIEVTRLNEIDGMAGVISDHILSTD